MPEVFQREINNLKKMLMYQRMLVEDSISKAMSALMNRDDELAQKVIDDDAELDQMEVKVEEECVRILTLHQPVATDLRFIVATLKINNDLERMGDLAAHIAKRSKSLHYFRLNGLAIDLPEMAGKVSSMVQRSLDSFVNLDAEQALQVCEDDDEVDSMRRNYKNIITDEIERNPEQSESLMEVSSLVRHLERLADIATNVAEETIYIVRGKIVRHVH